MGASDIILENLKGTGIYRLNITEQTSINLLYQYMGFSSKEKFEGACYAISLLWIKLHLASPVKKLEDIAIDDGIFSNDKNLDKSKQIEDIKNIDNAEIKFGKMIKTKSFAQEVMSIQSFHEAQMDITRYLSRRYMDEITPFLKFFENIGMKNTDIFKSNPIEMKEIVAKKFNREAELSYKFQKEEVSQLVVALARTMKHPDLHSMNLEKLQRMRESINAPYMEKQSVLKSMYSFYEFIMRHDISNYNDIGSFPTKFGNSKHTEIVQNVLGRTAMVLAGRDMDPTSPKDVAKTVLSLIANFKDTESCIISFTQKGKSAHAVGFVKSKCGLFFMDPNTASWFCRDVTNFEILILAHFCFFYSGSYDYCSIIKIFK